jgi:hypothetical protein
VARDECLQAHLGREALKLMAASQVGRIVQVRALPLDELILTVVVNADVVGVRRAQVERAILCRQLTEAVLLELEPILHVPRILLVGEDVLDAEDRLRW